jgi:pyruvate-formate lyase-activating enzyme
MKTKIYHISHAPATGEVSLFFWGCNFRCRGCLCQKGIYNFLLKENLHLFREEPQGIARPPERFLEFEEVMQALDRIKPETVLLEGQEASLDPQYGRLTEGLHEKFGSRNILCTNAYNIPDLGHTDELQVSLKAFSEKLHREHTGKSNKRVMDNFQKLHESDKKLTVSSVFIPGYIDAGEIGRVAEFIAGVDKNIPYHILPYFKAGQNPWRRPTREEMEEAARAARKHLPRVFSWTGEEELTYEVKRII